MGAICKKCLLREMAEAEQKMIETYKRAIKAEEQVDARLYEARLSACKMCDLLNAGTCLACGCYVELRAASTQGNCPHKKWQLPA